MKVAAGLLIALLIAPAGAVELQGRFTQGGLIRGKTQAGARVSLDGRNLRVSPDGIFIFGFGRDAPAKSVLWFPSNRSAFRLATNSDDETARGAPVSVVETNWLAVSMFPSVVTLVCAGKAAAMATPIVRRTSILFIAL